MDCPLIMGLNRVVNAKKNITLSNRIGYKWCYGLSVTNITTCCEKANNLWLYLDL